MGKRFEVLDSFRGLAAIFIILTHMQYVNGINNLTFFQNSSVFVEFFFILSGFVMTHSYAFKQDLKFKNFLISRIFRLVPLHLAMFLVIFLIELIKYIAYKKGIYFNAIPFEGKQAIREIIPNLLLLQSWLPTHTVISFNSPAWSISVEFYLYIIFFTTLSIKSKYRGFIWYIFSLIAFIILINDYEKANEILRGISSFFAGALTYILYKKFKDKISNLKYYFTILEAFLIISIGFLVLLELDHKSIILSIVFCLTIFIFSFEYGYLSQILKFKIFQTIGKFSYSIYLIHYPILVLFIAIIIMIQKISNIQLTVMIDGLRIIDFGSTTINNLSIFIIIGLVIYISSFTYKYIELKGQELGKNILATRKRD